MTPKTMIVTGSASGMGLATATHLASSGVHLALWDINSKGLEEIVKSFKAQYPGKILAQTVDVSDPSAVKAAFVEAQHRLGAINAIANFAGTGGRQLGVEAIWETSPQEFEFITNLNIKGLFNILGEALTPGFLSELQSVVHVASMFGTRGYKNGAVFAASKHAAVGMVKSAALEVGSRGIRVNCILPGPIETPMFHQVRDNAGLSTSASNTPIPRPGQPQEVANVATFLLGDQSSYVTGAVWNVDGGANA